MRDIVNSRRPEIGYIELTCENSNTPVLYIDLACEIMEDRVAPGPMFTLAAGLAADFAPGAPDANIVNAFGANGVTLSAAAKITAKDEFNNWVIHDTAQTYLVVSKIGGLDVSVLRQTHLTADELSASPEYVNTKAYDVLRKAVYPSALPFDLFTEEVRAYLGAMNVQRALLMETFRGPGAPNNPTDLEPGSGRDLQIWLPENTLLQTFLSRFVNVCGPRN